MPSGHQGQCNTFGQAPLGFKKFNTGKWPMFNQHTKLKKSSELWLGKVIL